MEIVNERQVGPLVVGFSIVFLITMGSFALLNVIQPDAEAVNRFYWLSARAAGLTSYELLSLSVVLGLSSASSVWDKLKLRKMMTQLHQFVSVLMIAFLVLHLYGLHQDTTIPFRWIQFVIPFDSSYHPFATGLGVLSVYAIVVMLVTSYFRAKIGTKVWRTIHFLYLPTFLCVTLHGLINGTDSSYTWAKLMYVIPLIVFVWLLLKRVSGYKTKMPVRTSDGTERS